MDDNWDGVSSSQIPIDLFVSKKRGGGGGELGFADSSGNILYKKVPNSPNNNNRSFLLLDAAQNPLLSISYQKNGCWDVYSGSGSGSVNKDLLFRVQRTLHRLTTTHLEAFLLPQTQNDTPHFKLRGCPFQRSCTLYKDNSIVAQTSLMYKLRQLLVSRSRFRLTIYPGSVDHAVIVSLIVIFLDC